MPDNKRHGWDKFDEGASVNAPKHTKAKRFGIGRSYSVCIIGSSVWAFVQFAVLLTVSFGIADGDFWWITVLTNSLKWVGMVILALGLYALWANVSPARKQVACNIIALTTVITVLCSVLRIIFRKASYGGFNSAGTAVLFIMFALMILNYRKKPPFVEKLWSYSGVTATVCFVTAVLKFIMIFTMQLLSYSFFQKAFLICFYGSEGFEIVSAVMIAVYYISRKRLVRVRPEN